MMRVTQIFILLILLIFGPANAAEKVKYVGQELSGEIKLTHENKIFLPPGMWEVSAITKTRGSTPWFNAAFVQIANSEIKAVLIIGYPREPVTNGWYRGSDDICDDYDGQQSNFHDKNVKTQANAIMSGICSAIYANTDVDQSLWDGWDVMRDTHEFIAQKNVKEYPAGLIHIDSSWYAKTHMANIYYSYNPEFSHITSKRGDWTKSDWSKYKIDDFPIKKAFMNKAIFSHQMVIDNSLKGYKKRKPVDLTPYDF